MESVIDEIEKELTHHILPFWMNLQDKEHGGMYGEVNYELQVNPRADKGGVITSRFLWTFSAAYRVTANLEYLRVAHHMYLFLKNHFVDEQDKGLYWMVDYKGVPIDQRKHIYNQAFGIYALTEYYRVTNDEEALELAKELYRFIELKGFDEETNAYGEEFDRSWKVVPNELLSENGIIADVTTNTHLHILEAYTNLYKVWPSEEVKSRIENIVHIFYTNIYDSNLKRLRVFFDKKWNSLLDLTSFGHDIEASWLLNEALQTIKCEKQEYSQMVIEIAYHIAATAVQGDGSLINEEGTNHLDKTRVWWVQAEAAVGFYNAFQLTNDPYFLDKSKQVWSYIKQYVIDQRPNGEWFWSVEEDGTPTIRNIGDAWKGSYHNGRFCLELMERVSKG